MALFSETKLGGGAVEIGVRTSAGELVAVITHPGPGCAWFLHPPGFARRRRVATRKAAETAATILVAG